MEEVHLKTRLAAWASHGGGPADAFRFTDEHLDTLGSLDPELRDTLFYEAVDGWIAAGSLTPEQLLLLTRRLVSQAFLFRGIGEPSGTEVFRRTFSSLILDAIVKHFNGRGGAHATCIESIAEAMERYTVEERDLRGYVAPWGGPMPRPMRRMCWLPLRYLPISPWRGTSACCSWSRSGS